MPVRLRALLEQRHWRTHRTFCVEYEKAAILVDPGLRGTAPSRSQLHRWLSGELKELPYGDHCRVLEKMFPEWSARQLFESVSADEISRIMARQPNRTERNTRPVANGAAISRDNGPFADVTAVFVSRSEFAHKFSLDELLNGVSDIRAVGISLNLLCQEYGDRRLRSLLDDGCTIRCLFLDPHGNAIKAREHEEGYEPGLLSSLTLFNLQVLGRLRLQLPDEKRERMQLHVYDEPARFNITIVDNRKCIVQPYLPALRGVDSPTWVIDRRDNDDDLGLFSVFEQVFDLLWKRSRPVG